MWTIYRLNCKPTGQSYIGLTRRSLWDRWCAHCTSAKCQYKPSLIHRAIAEYGETAFTLQVMDTAMTFEDAREREDYFILLHDTLAPKGLNLL